MIYYRPVINNNGIKITTIKINTIKMTDELLKMNELYHDLAFFKKDIENSKKLLIEQKKIIKLNIGGQEVLVNINTIPDNYIDKLAQQGFVVIPIIPKTDLSKIRNDLDVTIDNYPEYKKPINNKPIIHQAGGFAASGCPSSIHNKDVRNLRIFHYNQITKLLFNELLAKYNKDVKEYNFEILFDRFMKRLKGQFPQIESFHRDVMNKDQIEKEDEIFGGWINLDDLDQEFSCISGSHLGLNLYELTSGFSELESYLKKKSFSKSEIIGYMNELNSYKTKVKIPAGSCIIFYQYILHEVLAVKKTYNMYRLFTGCRITKSIKSIYIKDGKDILNDLLDKQAIIQLPGSMNPPLYSKQHQMTWMFKSFNFIPDDPTTKMSVVDWSHITFQPQLLITKTTNKDYTLQINKKLYNIIEKEENGNKIIEYNTNDDTIYKVYYENQMFKKMEYKCIDRYMKSLKEYNLQLYPEYIFEEKKMYWPHFLEIPNI